MKRALAFLAEVLPHKQFLSNYPLFLTNTVPVIYFSFQKNLIFKESPTIPREVYVSTVLSWVVSTLKKTYSSPQTFFPMIHFLSNPPSLWKNSVSQENLSSEKCVLTGIHTVLKCFKAFLLIPPKPWFVNRGYHILYMYWTKLSLFTIRFSLGTQEQYRAGTCTCAYQISPLQVKPLTYLSLQDCLARVFAETPVLFIPPCHGRCFFFR